MVTRRTRKTRTTNKTEKVLEHLQKYGSITSLEAIEFYGATRLSAIIFNLKKIYNIAELILNVQIDTAMLHDIQNTYCVINLIHIPKKILGG